MLVTASLFSINPFKHGGVVKKKNKRKSKVRLKITRNNFLRFMRPSQSTFCQIKKEEKKMTGSKEKKSITKKLGGKKLTMPQKRYAKRRKLPLRKVHHVIMTR